MDFATECGFENDDSAKELMDASIKAMNDDDVFEDEQEKSLEDKLKGIIRMYQERINDYEENVKEFEKDHGKLDY